MEPYIIVLAGSSQEASKYVRRAGLPRGRWRIAASAASIRGIRAAHIHALPSFHHRRDGHSILAELRYAKCEWFDVEMPGRVDAPPVDQGDGMGEQLTIEDALENTDPLGFLSDSLDDDELPTEEELERVRHEVAEERRAKVEPTPEPEKRQPKPRRPAGSSPRSRVAPKPAPPVTNLFD